MPETSSASITTGAGTAQKEDQAVFGFKPVVTVGDWLSPERRRRVSSFGPKAFASIEEACVALGVTRAEVEAEVEKAETERFWADQAVKAKFERWCWAHEPLIRHLQENPALVAELEARVTSPA